MPPTLGVLTPTLPPSGGTGTAASSSPPTGLMYMLLAGPGMGKSIFSASVDSKLMARVDQGIELVVRLGWWLGWWLGWQLGWWLGWQLGIF